MHFFRYIILLTKYKWSNFIPKLCGKIILNLRLFIPKKIINGIDILSNLIRRPCTINLLKLNMYHFRPLQEQSKNELQTVQCCLALDSLYPHIYIKYNRILYTHTHTQSFALCVYIGDDRHPRGLHVFSCSPMLVISFIAYKRASTTTNTRSKILNIFMYDYTWPRILNS